MHEFYNAMREGKRITTTQVPAETFLKAFSDYAKAGKDVLYIGCSSALSGSVNTAMVVAKEVMETYKDAKIICVDALNSSFGQGIQLMMASKRRVMKPEQVHKLVEQIDSNPDDYQRAQGHQVATYDEKGRPFDWSQIPKRAYYESYSMEDRK